MSAEAQTSAPLAPASAGQSITPNANPEAEGLLKQADMLKEQQTEAVSALEKERAEKAAMAAELAFFRKQAAEEAERYKIAQEPKYNEFIKELEVTAGKLSEEKKKQYYSAFTKPQFKEDAEIMYAQHKEKVELRASKKQFEEELAKEREEKNKLKETAVKASQQMSGMRRTYVDATNHQQQQVETRKEVTVTASLLNPNEIMSADPSVAELPFLQKFGYSNNVDVNASSAGAAGPFGGIKPIRKSVMAAREHGLLYDEEGELNFPNSARYHNPTFFAWMVNEAPMDKVDLTDFVAINASKSFVETKRVDGDNF